VIAVAGEGSYTFDGTMTLLFTPEPAFRGRAHGIYYRFTDESGQSTTGTYTPTLTGAGAGSGGSGGSAPSVHLTTAPLNVATAAGAVPIGCGLSSGLIADCRVALVATVSGHQVTLGRGDNSPDTAVANVVVRVALTSRGRELSRRLGGVAVRAVGSVVVAGLLGHVTGTVALRTIARSFILPHSVRFAAHSAKLSASERRYLKSLTRSLRDVRRVDCIGAARDVRNGSRRTSLARSRARVVCTYLKGRLPRTTVFAPRAEGAGDRRGTTRHADLLVHY
jgi:outer membrane protein OmpA-like peptidoglycan-associated protein